ncbi:MAG: hypothetical protein KGL42_06935 [Betaproteobacteria bacterium]|nr:hypothetical protein [Betaproteobacteria bacterium]
MVACVGFELDIALRLILAALSACAVLMLGACSSLLPRGQARTDRPWATFDQAHAAFASIQPYKTRVEDLRKLGIDPFVTPNVAILSYADILRDLVPPSGNHFALDPGIRDCLQHQNACKGYSIDQSHVDHKRVGSFWLDFLDFRRRTITSGWRFKMLMLVVDDRVVYKIWSGQPDISEVQSTANPLGPLQGFGESALGRF